MREFASALDPELQRWLRQRPYGDSMEVGFTAKEVPREVHLARQVHGRHLAAAPSDFQGADQPTADGVYALKEAEPIVIGVKTADCLPLLVVSKSFFAVIHAGWRGLVAGIVQELSRLLERFGDSVDQCSLLLGPCICQNHYPVRQDVVEAAQASPLPLAVSDFNEAVAPQGADQWLLSQQKICLAQLAGLGVKPEQIAVINSCTFAQVNGWPSYRRLKGELAGARLVSWLRFNP